MRVISLVPSLTETLIECGAEVVGRTRFCVHTSGRKIPAVGGTKDIDWKLVHPLKPDLIVLDKEENTEAMAHTCPFNWMATHITSLESLSTGLLTLSKYFKDPVRSKLQTLSNEAISWANAQPVSNNDIAIKEWWIKPECEIKKYVYLIWKPWMAVSRNTFIGDIAHLAGFPLENYQTRYPQIQLDNSSKDTLLLCSSEPFPFHRYKDEIMKLGYPCALVDGEHYSWFGIRSLEFLNKLNTNSKV